MKAFDDQTTDGNERAFRRGRVVPDGDINLAYVKTPRLSPRNNIVVVDTSRITEENISDRERRKLYYADANGILVDEDGKAIEGDRFPVISDVFSVDEDFSMEAGSEYTTESILPFLHVSRYFHLDLTGLVPDLKIEDHSSDALRVVDSRGQEYENCRIRITPARLPNAEETGSSWAYRVYVYIDSEINEDLYLNYHKVELNADGLLVNRVIDYKEILNPEPFFEYRPEESEVLDPLGWGDPVYSTKLASHKENILNPSSPISDGYNIFVSKKAIPDNRIYQLFRWRLICNFRQDIDSTFSNDIKKIKCGVLVTDSDLGSDIPSRSPYVFYNLALSRYNSKGINFINPANEFHTEEFQDNRDYWFVNIDTDDLSSYDILVWSPDSSNYDFSDYIPKLENFVESSGGTVLIDTSNWLNPGETIPGEFSTPFHASSGSIRVPANADQADAPAGSQDIRWADELHALVDGNAKLGAWSMVDGENNEELLHLSYSQLSNPGYTQYMDAIHDDYTSIVEVQLADDSWRSAVALRQIGNGSIILSSLGLPYTASAVFSHIDNELISDNFGENLYGAVDYVEHINSFANEGAMKLIYNTCFYAIRGKLLESNDAEDFSTNWRFPTPWVSSWVINNEDDALNTFEKDKYDFIIDPRDIFAEEPDTEPIWKRRISNKTIDQTIDEALEEVIDDPRVANRVDGATREYALEITNPNVYGPSVVIGGDYLNVWTDAYTPNFVVPAELGPHIIRYDLDGENRPGLIDDHARIQYIERVYPEKPYRVRIDSSYTETQELWREVTGNYEAIVDAIETTTKTVTKTIKSSGPGPLLGVASPKPLLLDSKRFGDIHDITPEEMLTITDNPRENDYGNVKAYSDITWAGSQLGTRLGEDVGSDRKAGIVWRPTFNYPAYGVLKPKSIETWQDKNYYSSINGPSNLSWPYFGLRQRLGVGARSDIVRFIQDAHNRILGAGYFSGNSLLVDGFYGSRTKNAIENFQDSFNARYIDGEVDAETYYIFASQINRMKSDGYQFDIDDTDWTKYYGWTDRINLDRISDGQPERWCAKQSWSTGGPKIIWEYYKIKLRRSTDIYGVNVNPYLEGETDTLIVKSIEIGEDIDLENYESTNAQLNDLDYELIDNETIFIPCGPYAGDTIIVGVAQDKPAWGESRMFGLRDVSFRIMENSTDMEDYLPEEDDGPEPIGSASARGISIYSSIPQPLTLESNYNIGSDWQPHGGGVHIGSAPSYGSTHQYTKPVHNPSAHGGAKFATYQTVNSHNSVSGNDQWDTYVHYHSGPKKVTYKKKVRKPVKFKVGGTVTLRTLEKKTIQLTVKNNPTSIKLPSSGEPPRTEYEWRMIYDDWGGDEHQAPDASRNLDHVHNPYGSTTISPYAQVWHTSNTEPPPSSVWPTTIAHSHDLWHDAEGGGWGSPDGPNVPSHEHGRTDTERKSTQGNWINPKPTGKTRVTGGEFEEGRTLSNRKLSKFKYSNITIDNEDIIAEVTTAGKATFYTQAFDFTSDQKAVSGVNLPTYDVFSDPSYMEEHQGAPADDAEALANATGFVYYSMNTSGRFNPIPEVGMVSKIEGVKLLCNADKTPVGFPPMPTTVGPNEYHRHYAKLRIANNGSDTSVRCGFFDINKQEFITLPDGTPEVSYIDYIRRGPQNIFIAVASSYVELEEQTITPDDDAPILPFSWAMPVYGVCQRSGPKISLDPLPQDLGIHDIWPIAVRDGLFSRFVNIRSGTSGGATGIMNDYQDQTVHAFYSLPEAERAGYSRIYGPPNMDVSEEPIILADDVIQVRQAPILNMTFPTENPGPADPRRPILRFFTRLNPYVAWEEQSMSSIRDYNTSTGEIYLAEPLISNDPTLLRVDYTSTRRSYHFKKYDDIILNLNAYMNPSFALSGEPIYVYIVPRYVLDEEGSLIQSSVQSSTLRVNFDGSIFNPLHPDYDPLAVQLGLVYLSPALDIDDLSIVDARRRGGGLRDRLNISEVNRIINQTSAFWDIKDGNGISYPKGGYVILRLPEELQNSMPEDEIQDVIQKNIAAGVGFKIQTLDGKEWVTQ